MDASTLVPTDLYEEALAEPFLFRTGAQSFYATIKVKGAPFVRFDPGCMHGTTARAKALMQQLLNRTLAPTHVHQWTPGAVLVIDNWKMLHRRADATAYINRTLYRVSVMGGAT
ncbi:MULTISPECIES: TauD/TfdA family dioxygenase [Achromobacter]|uniref:TauD/TfdA family dioxygenase n=1 Tax=Alcaligenes xylosoxydans xylosoxydans TaxID=85698 RepID=A0A9X3KX02_ALCXX|nr:MULTISPECIES: TauD/TfdA family dioxygenase [Achromobacter]MCD0500803.1 TauD/TfdA family dioxygenase [Achromobacter sp. MY14]MCZ8401369.1 TauD/TfdA family dioxygenase [Achromobacter xylosoxidans]MDH0519741.1 TauD/TfdA family dioxygenase [Achromobacter xylosoxidans]MDH0544631.1 TauD/TfdA family dioxygenase [Achromobacter xylosoxidans]QQE60063.1 TauD/TfdA family dioxygenase [Achromobacter xylosoxidans]